MSEGLKHSRHRSAIGLIDHPRPVQFDNGTLRSKKIRSVRSEKLSAEGSERKASNGEIETSKSLYTLERHSPRVTPGLSDHQERARTSGGKVATFS